MRADHPSTRVLRHPVRRMLAALAALAVATTTFPAGAQVSNDPNSATRTLVILGASYAESWKTPPLPGYRVVNRGIGGEQTGQMRARFERDVVSARPSAVLIWGHINNITQSDIVGAPPERIEAVKKAVREDYLAMLKAARAAGIEVILATEIPMAESDGLVNQARGLLGRLMGKPSYYSQVNVHVRDLNTFVRQLAAREQLRLLDFEKVFAPDGGARKSEYAQPDRSHVTPAGYQALTQYAVAELGKRR